MKGNILKIYLVGGAVRDKFLNLPITERDWLVLDANEKIMKKLGFQKVGKDFPVFLHPKSQEEYALARVEKKSGKRHNNFNCSTKKISLQEDLKRRDLTINAIAMDKYENIFDPFNGIRDIKMKIIRHISNAFIEDPLRILRVARFYAKLFHLNFTIDMSTFKLIKSMSHELCYISSERIWKETEKALNTKNPQIYFYTLKECGAMKVVFPEIYNLFGIKYKKKNSNLGNRMLNILKIISRISKDIQLRFSAVVYQFFLISKEKEKYIEKFCKKKKIPNSFMKLAKIISKYHFILLYPEKYSIEKILKIFQKINVWKEPENLEKIIAFNQAKEFKKKNKNFWKQRKLFLRKLYKATKYISITSIIQKGFRGKNIGIQINKKRIRIAKKFKKNHLHSILKYK
ncbi:hypothetical protein [bacterium endosymbiont of Pedicinus badii]|uniref:hypothetical protein n=1 Tax=bacterium endosymbiont of Pedicinus badii TaxID=1719126 RepID=UPI0009B95AE3|nr:hypothetical protein [bacterium endosymbiont of Pedicinus badii]OQM34163.1 hypothetical protein AOQ89_02380 [bacterium endosymbiont of Pedicinus badii]